MRTLGPTQKYREKLGVLKSNYDSVLIIHYSSYAPKDGQDKGYSSRVTSIAVLHPSSSTMHSFSLNLVAEQLGVPWDAIDAKYDEIEHRMLSDFYDFVRAHPTAIWVHWKMSNIVYGFQAIAHRYTVLSRQTPPTIQDSNRINLASTIEQGYGRQYVDHPLMYNLFKLNETMNKEILSGEQEVEAFEKKELKRLHASNLAKVYALGHVLDRVLTGKLKTQRTNLLNRLSEVTERPASKILGLIAVLFALIQLGMLAQSLLDAGNKVGASKPAAQLSPNGSSDKR